MGLTSVSYLWREPKAAEGFRTGVSLHSHTSMSRETLDFIAELSTDFALLQPVMRWLEARSARCSGIRPDYHRSYWTPPLVPRLAFDLERKQIEDKLQLPGLVSISDHDDIRAPSLLRSIDSARHIPVSLEWTVPYGPTAFHLGLHNLPSARAAEWMERLEAFTAMPQTERPAGLLREILAELHELPGVLTVFNHPLWDLYRIGREKHEVLMNGFIASCGQYVHALELNGLRDWKENREVSELAGRWNQLVISGGDRHGLEPNANVNLTHAESFTEFVREVRVERRSHVLYMPQYAEPWKHRILQSTLDAIRNHPHFPEGSRGWDERVYHPSTSGEIRPLSTLWNDGRPPVYLRVLMEGVRMLGAAPVSGGLRRAWTNTAEMQLALGKSEG